MAAALLARWRRIFVADGLILTAPEGTNAGAIRIRTRVRPLVRMSELVDMLVRQLGPEFPEHTREPPARVTTLEGEYAVVLHLRGRGPRGELNRTVAILLGDDSFDAIDGATAVPALRDRLRAAVEGLANGYSLGLGDNRRRRYFYRPPVGWQGIARPQSAIWLPPRFPKTKATITVYDAQPVEPTPVLAQNRALFQDLDSDFVRDEPRPPLPAALRPGLQGRIVPTTGRYPGRPPEIVHEATLADERYRYFARLECAEEQLAAAGDAFLALVSSIEPLPGPARTAQWSPTRSS